MYFTYINDRLKLIIFFYLNLGTFRSSKIEFRCKAELLIEKSFQLAIIAHQLSVTCCDIAPLQGQNFYQKSTYIHFK